jgi:antirestriction protein ArdC
MKAHQLYDTITAKIIEKLEQGVCPWRKDWNPCTDIPRNWDGRPYSGINWLLLTMAAYEQPVFVTFKKAQALGGQVRKGEKGHIVTFWNFFKNKDKVTGDEKTVPFLKHYYVFNVTQCDGLPEIATPELSPIAPIDVCEAIVAGMPHAPEIDHAGQGRCFYRPDTDTVSMAKKDSFNTPEGYYSTLFHELAHSTGHKSRLNRRTLTSKASFGSNDYGREELVAELSAANLCATAGISATIIDNQAAYLASWIKTLQEDNKAIVWATGQASKAANFILGKTEEPKSED